MSCFSTLQLTATHTSLIGSFDDRLKARKGEQKRLPRGRGVESPLQEEMV